MSSPSVISPLPCTTRAKPRGADRADWSDLELDGPRPPLLVRCGKGGKPCHQPAEAPVFCGLEGKRLQPPMLVGFIRRDAERARIEKRVTAHTLLTETVASS